MFPIVDEQGNIIDAATRGHCHDGSKLLHPVVHLHVFNSKGDLYLQRRPMWKDIQPGRWDTAVGGHVDLGENIQQALRREVSEELGIDIDGIKNENEDERSAMPLAEQQRGKNENKLLAIPYAPYVFESERERELVYPHRLIYDGPIQPSAETDGGRFWSMDELRSTLTTGELTPNFVSEIQRLGILDEKNEEC